MSDEAKGLVSEPRDGSAFNVSTDGMIHDCALVFEGGGYRGAYTAGIANALLENHIYFDFVCGLSAGASHTVNYVSRDRRRVEQAFLFGIILDCDKPCFVRILIYELWLILKLLIYLRDGA